MFKCIDKTYVWKYITLAKATNNEKILNNCLYRIGTQMEVIPCDGDNQLTSKQQTIMEAAETLLNLQLDETNHS